MKAPNEAVYLLALPEEIYCYEAKQTEGSWLNAAKKISKILHGEAQLPEGHSVSPRMLSSYKHCHHPLPCGLHPTHSISLSLGKQEVTLPRTTGQKEWWAPLFTE